MKMSRRFSQVLLTGTTLLLASTLVFLYHLSSTDQASAYVESRDLIRHIKQLDSQWETEILKARIAISHNYTGFAADRNDRPLEPIRDDGVQP
jgi:hypothetical protein